MKAPYIPSPTSLPQEHARVLNPMKQVLDHLTGTRSGVIAALPTTATTAVIIAKINEIVVRLNFSGE